MPWNDAPTTVLLASRELCQATGLVLRAGQSYKVEIELPDNATLPPDQQWRDRTIPIGAAEGFSSGENIFVFAPFLPFRRVLTARWFVPMVRIGAHGAEYHPLNQSAGPSGRRFGSAEFTPRRDGQLFLFVNDAILPGPWLRTLYENNSGIAKVTVSASASTR